MVVVLSVAFSPWTSGIAFLWHNFIGAVVVVIVGLTISAFERRPFPTAAAESFQQL
jgi:hypothetical protein